MLQEFCPQLSLMKLERWNEVRLCQPLQKNLALKL